MPLDSVDWSTALPDWEERILDGRSLVPELPLFDKVAERALTIFKRLKVPDLIGNPTFGEVCEDWVFDFVRALFGCYDPVLKQRMIQEFFLLVPKKNGKSAISAGIMVTAMILNERPLAEMMLISETQTIAGITFRTARGIIKLDPDLDALFHIKDHEKKIIHRVTEAELKILSADGDVVTGSKATAVLVDEAHVMGMKSKAAGVYLELRGGLASRPEGFFLQITTQSKVEPAGQFKKELQRARAARDGTSEGRRLAVLYELPREMAKSEAWRDEKTWAMVNPNIERSVSITFLREKYREALADGADALALFASQHLNVEIGIGLHSDRWVAAEHWPKAAVEGLSLEELFARAEVVTIGGDMGGADDLASLAVQGRCRETRNRLVWAKAWCLPEVLKKRKEIAPKLEDLAEVGDLVIDGDPNAHIEGMVEICVAARDAGLLSDNGAVGLDAYGVSALVDALFDLKFTEDQVQAVRQGFALNGAIKGIERRLIDGTLQHGGQPLLTWCMGNAKAEARGNNVLITKERAGVAKIDPLIALFNATILMDQNPVVARQPKYQMLFV